jgi:serine/threonine-protein kinase RsbW
MRPKDRTAGHRGAGAAEAVDRGCLAAITMPAATGYVSFARLATAHLCGLVGLSIGRIADLRLVVDEACGQFMHGNAAFSDAETPDVPLALRFERRADRLRITVRGPIRIGWPDSESLGWLVIEALVGDVDYEVEPEDGVGTLSFDESLSADGLPGDILWFATS